MKLIKQVSLLFSMFSHAQCALLIIASINGKHRASKRDTAESILGQKSGPALDRPARPAMKALYTGNMLL